MTKPFISAGHLNHASTIHAFGNDVVIAWYAGDGECHQTQRVYITMCKDGDYLWQFGLEGLTGNPVFVPVNNTRAMLLYSRFEKLVQRPVEWWKYCSLWYRFVDYKDGVVTVSNEHRFTVQVEDRESPERLVEIDMPLGYLGRCNSINHNGEILLPLYREEGHMIGVIMAGRANQTGEIKWRVRGTIASQAPCLQPTLWSADGVVRALLRNYRPRLSKPLAFYSESNDNGHNWSELALEPKYYNYNNSILAIDQKKEEPLVVWNDDSTGRQNLTIGRQGDDKLLLDSYGAYPAYTIDANQNIHVTYSGRDQTTKAVLVIKHKVLDSSLAIIN